MTDKVQVSGTGHGPAGEPAAVERPHQFGLTAAMALIVGSIIGVGIFNLPTSLAAYGPITLVSMALTTVGALGIATIIYIAIALGVFGTLTVEKAISSGGTALAVAADPRSARRATG